MSADAETLMAALFAMTRERGRADVTIGDLMNRLGWPLVRVMAAVYELEHESEVIPGDTLWRLN